MTIASIYILSFVLAFAADLLWGDPPRIPHPVKLMGKAALFLENLLRKYFKGAGEEKFAGAALVIFIAGGSFLLAFGAIYTAYRMHTWAALALSAYFFYTSIAVKDMLLHVQKVKEAVAGKDLPLARERVALIVSRDTAHLEEEGIIRAALESLFENTADGVVAPLFYAALGGPLGGPALVVFFKAVSTLDSMFGYKSPRYYYFGWAPARLDDILNFIPARLTALIFILLGALRGLDWKGGIKTLLKDRNKHESPNSAWPEAAAAGVLGLRLGGIDYHKGQEIRRPFINEQGRSPRFEDLQASLSLFVHASILALGLALLLMAIKYLIF